jgi:anti-anti-sigma factor
MEIREFREGDVLVLAPEGNMAGSEETSVIEMKLGTVLKVGFRLLVLDCAGVGQLTGAAIRVLLMTSRKLDRAEGRLVLCEMNAKVKKAFLISGFDKDFNVVATRKEALQRVLEPLQPRPPRSAKRAADAGAPRLVVIESPLDAALPTPAVQTSSPVQVGLPPSEPDLREALADALLDALGVYVCPSEPARSGCAVGSDPHVLARRILAALRVGVS